MDDFESNLRNCSLDYGKRRAPSKTQELRASCPPSQQKRESTVAVAPSLPADFMKGIMMEDEFGNPVGGGGAELFENSQYRPQKSTEGPLRYSMPVHLEEEQKEVVEQLYQRSSTNSSTSSSRRSRPSNHRRRTDDLRSSGLSPRKQSNRRENGGNLRHSMPVQSGFGDSPTSTRSRRATNNDSYPSPVSLKGISDRDEHSSFGKSLPFARSSGGSRLRLQGSNQSEGNDYPRRIKKSPSNGSDGSRSKNSHSSQSSPSPSSCKKYLRHYIDSLQLPPGSFSTVLKCYESIDSRKWLIENSASMKVRDAHCMKVGSKMEYIESDDDVTRWHEFTQCFDFHVKMSARCWIPTEFWLVNDPGPSVGPQRFCVACGSQEDLSEEREMANEIIANVTLKQKRNPLASQVRRIEKRIGKIAPRLISHNKHVVVMLCTGGKPSDEFGNAGSAVMQDFVDSLVSLSKLPVKIIVRLCTDNDRITDFFNRLDSKLTDIDVLDDYFGEAMEVYLHNPWLNYGFGLHRLREAGLASDLIGDLDERCFTIEDIHQFCKEFITGEDVNLPHPRNWDAFISSLASLLSNEKLQWNPIKKKQTPWIDIKKLEKMFSRGRDPPETNTSSHYSGAGVGRREEVAGHCSPSKTASTASNNNSNDMTLEQVIQRWSHQPPNYKALNSMQDLLVNMPTLFPPTNTRVEAHAYFGKWKCMSREAFTGEGEELKALLKRAVRRSKLFIHPDKLPNDLTEKQTLLFRTIWDVVQDQEMKTLS